MLRIVTDSTSDIPGEIRAQENIEVVPLRVFFGEESFLDWEELKPAEFYK